jgi:hypothetical protein
LKVFGKGEEEPTILHLFRAPILDFCHNVVTIWPSIFSNKSAMASFEPLPGELLTSTVTRAIEHFKVIGAFQFEANRRVVKVLRESTRESLLKELGIEDVPFFNPNYDAPEIKAVLSDVETLDFQNIEAVYQWFHAIGKLLKGGSSFSLSSQASLAKTIRSKQGYDSIDNLRSLITDENVLKVGIIQRCLIALEEGGLYWCFHNT